jgi:hypothetical protein
MTRKEYFLTELNAGNTDVTPERTKEDVDALYEAMWDHDLQRRNKLTYDLLNNAPLEQQQRS